jgi:hypothetical protein
MSFVRHVAFAVVEPGDLQYVGYVEMLRELDVLTALYVHQS